MQESVAERVHELSAGAALQQQPRANAGAGGGMGYIADDVLVIRARGQKLTDSSSHYLSPLYIYIYIYIYIYVCEHV